MTKLIVILMAIALCACLFAGCSGAPEVDENVSKSSSFIIVEGGDCYYIVYHKDTKVMYVVSGGSYNRGTFTVMVNPDGTPMIWEGN